ncbi:hypothetical protein QQS21_008803 [Conoideocrella luteorostrata]|uniref:Uncharacterized protein n=1 Tax=Conoideocrella luteorostrata TaxID=1105319 RepID=A0AAJ0FR18_9HYPO|nr:hypothetical protein QQS21_008803 [Conoideocrella luteorostrata]
MVDLSSYLSEHDSNFRRARLPALYADFRSQRTLNPDGYRANVVAWQSALSCLAFNGLLSCNGLSSSALIIDIDDSLPRALESKQFGQPLALGTALRDAISHQKLMPVNTFLRTPSQTYSLKISSLPWNAAEWAFRQLGITNQVSSEDTVPNGRYVIISNIETACQTFKRQIAGESSRFDRVFTKLQFRKLVAHQLVPGNALTDEDIEVLLVCLARDKHMIEYDGVIIRIRDPEDELGISQEDAAMASIKELISNIRHQIEVLNGRIEYLQQETRAALERNNRVAAMAKLKSKKMTEASLAKRYMSLNQLEDVAAKIEQATDQVQLIKMMKSSVSALRSLNSQVGSGTQVEELMNQIRQQMSETDEVAAILAESTGEPIDELELDDELAVLENEAHENEEPKVERKEDNRADTQADKVRSEIDQLPDPPSEIPSSSGQLITPAIETRIANLSLGRGK